MTREELEERAARNEREAIAQYVEIWMRAYSKGSVRRCGSVEEIGEALATAIRERHSNP